MWGGPEIYLNSLFQPDNCNSHRFFGENPVCTNVPVQQSDRDCKRKVQAGIPSPDTSHPCVIKAVWVNPSNSPLTAARGDMSHVSDKNACVTPSQIANPRNLNGPRLLSFIAGFDMIGYGFGHRVDGDSCVTDIRQRYNSLSLCACKTTRLNFGSRLMVFYHWEAKGE